MKAISIVFFISTSFALFRYGNCEEACTCGVKQNERIVGGQAASANEYPWMAAVAHAQNRYIYCGASIINEKWVLSAAHCFSDDTDPATVNAIVGDHDLTSTYYHSWIDVSRIIRHPQYDDTTKDNDVALLELKKPITFGKGLAPVCLPFGITSEQFVGKNLHTIGWGNLEEGGRGTLELQELSIPIISRKQCNEMYSGAITDNMFCAYKSGYDTCQGDSGGPTTVEVSGKHVQLGVVSWGYGCARHGKPGVYAELSKYVDWIKKETSVTFCKVSSRKAGYQGSQFKYPTMRIGEDAV